jgi:hypothetical protein
MWVWIRLRQVLELPVQQLVGLELAADSWPVPWVQVDEN